MSKAHEEHSLFDFFIYDAADAVCHRCRFRTNHRGYSGGGFADYQSKGSWLEFQMKDSLLQQHTSVDLLVRYAAGGNDRPVDVIVDNKLVGSLDLKSTGNWNTWHIETILLKNLAIGFSSIRLKANKSNGPNIDTIILIPREAEEEEDLPTYRPTLSPSTQNPLPLAPPKPVTNPTFAPVSVPTRPSPSPLPIAPTLSPIAITPSPITPTPSPIVPTPSPIVSTPSPIVSTPSPVADTMPVIGIEPFDQAVVLKGGGSLGRGEFKSSPNGKFQFGLDLTNGVLMLKDVNGKIIWSAPESKGAKKAHMQMDGNFLTRLGNGRSNWKTATSKNKGAKLILDNGGQVAIWSTQATALWLAGLPRSEYYDGPPNTSLQYPLRGAFYYAWYPETWSVNGKPVSYSPTLGKKYSNGDPVVQRTHINALNHIHVDVAIVSWWGIDVTLERARLTNLLDKSIGTPLKWTIYQEQERYSNESPQDIRRNTLDYLRKWFAWHPSWAYIDNRPIIFLFNEGSCDVAKRWSLASNNTWYVVLKSFRGFERCPYQPDHWHQYGPASAVVHVKGNSFAVSPGFRRADGKGPRLPRLSKSSFRENVRNMVDSGENWQLVTTFNEWGEGTAVEAAYDWGGTDSGEYGVYMDALHDIHNHTSASREQRNIFWE